MAINVNEFIDKYAGTNPKDVEIAETFERMIDDKLAKGENYFTLKGRISLGAKILLIRKYKDAGWGSIGFFEMNKKTEVLIYLDHAVGDLVE